MDYFTKYNFYTRSFENLLDSKTTVRLNLFFDSLMNQAMPRGFIGEAAEEESWLRHILDSILVLQETDIVELFGAVDVVIDLGSGAGLPGVALGIIFPGTRFVLVEAMEKRSKYILEIKEALGLENITVINKRVEDIKADDVPGNTRLILFRAFLKPLVSLEMALRVIPLGQLRLPSPLRGEGNRVLPKAGDGLGVDSGAGGRHESSASGLAATGDLPKAGGPVSGLGVDSGVVDRHATSALGRGGSGVSTKAGEGPVPGFGVDSGVVDRHATSALGSGAMGGNVLESSKVLYWRSRRFDISNDTVRDTAREPEGRAGGQWRQVQERIRELGFRVLKFYSLECPPEMNTRGVYLIEHTGNTDAKYPRSWARIKKDPLIQSVD